MRWQPDIRMVTTKPGRLYLHVFTWPQDRTIFYWDFRHKLKRAYLLADGERSLMVLVPQEAPDPIDSVVVLEYETAWQPEFRCRRMAWRRNP